jgi:adenine-specific DNA-methyltransferase
MIITDIKADANVPIVLKEQSFDKASISTKSDVIAMGDAEKFLDSLPEEPIFDLVVTSPPYNIGKEYEKKVPLDDYLEWQKKIIRKIYPRLKDTGSICWQVGNYAENGSITPLDIYIAPFFMKELGMKLRNRIIWHFGHGLHSKRRFSGRYEVVLWFTKSDDYKFDLDSVRIPSKYPSKRYYKGKKKGELSGNALGKNPEDVWDIPNVKSNHIEKTEHPCQFPVGLIERLVLSLTSEGDLVYDPFSGVSSAGVASIIHGRHYWGTEISESYVEIGKDRLQDALNGVAKYRPYDKPIYDNQRSSLSKVPDEWLDAGLDSEGEQ